MFSKVEVNGPGAHPIWKFLKSSQEVGTEEIGWNFVSHQFAQSLAPFRFADFPSLSLSPTQYKFLVDKEGHVVKRYSQRVKPFDMEQDIVDLLKK